MRLRNGVKVLALAVLALTVAGLVNAFQTQNFPVDQCQAEGGLAVPADRDSKVICFDPSGKIKWVR